MRRGARRRLSVEAAGGTTCGSDGGTAAPSIECPVCGYTLVGAGGAHECRIAGLLGKHGDGNFCSGSEDDARSNASNASRGSQGSHGSFGGRGQSLKRTESTDEGDGGVEGQAGAHTAAEEGVVTINGDATATAPEEEEVEELAVRWRADSDICSVAYVECRLKSSCKLKARRVYRRRGSNGNSGAATAAAGGDDAAPAPAPTVAADPSACGGDGDAGSADAGGAKLTAAALPEESGAPLAPMGSAELGDAAVVAELARAWPPGLRVRTRCALAAASKEEIPAGSVGRVLEARSDGVLTILLDSDKPCKTKCDAEPCDLINEGFIPPNSKCTVTRIELSKGDQTLVIPDGTPATILSHDPAAHAYEVRVNVKGIKAVCDVAAFNAQPLIEAPGRLTVLKNVLLRRKSNGELSSMASTPLESPSPGVSPKAGDTARKRPPMLRLPERFASWQRRRNGEGASPMELAGRGSSQSPPTTSSPSPQTSLQQLGSPQYLDPHLHGGRCRRMSFEEFAGPGGGHTFINSSFNSVGDTSTSLAQSFDLQPVGVPLPAPGAGDLAAAMCSTSSFGLGSSRGSMRLSFNMKRRSFTKDAGGVASTAFPRCSNGGSGGTDSSITSAAAAAGATSVSSPLSSPRSPQPLYSVLKPRSGGLSPRNSYRRRVSADERAAAAAAAAAAAVGSSAGGSSNGVGTDVDTPPTAATPTKAPTRDVSPPPTARGSHPSSDTCSSASVGGLTDSQLGQSQSLGNIARSAFGMGTPLVTRAAQPTPAV